MRIAFSAVFTLVILAQIWCAFRAKHSGKPIGRYVAAVNYSLIPPLLGNLIIIGSHNKTISVIGCYIYFLGVDFVVFTLARFTVEYCKTRYKKLKIPWFVYVLLVVDYIQFMLNPFLGHAFDMAPVEFDGSVYWDLVPYAGQAYHRIVAYSILLAVVIILLVTAHNMPKIYRERFTSVSLVLVFVGLWQLFYLFSDSPVDRSMLGYGVLGIMIYFFALRYRPLRLLDRMLSGIVSGMDEALYIFDPTGKCIWANETGFALAGVKDQSVEKATENLVKLFGDPGNSENGAAQRTIGTGDDARYYVLEENRNTDEKGKFIGTYLRISDVTDEQNRMKREMYDATHDLMTGLYTREYLFTNISDRLFNDKETSYYALYIDVKNFQMVNDIFGNDFGDHAIRHIGEWISNYLSPNCIYGRLIGAAFGVLMPKDEWEHDHIEKTLANFILKDQKAHYHVLIHVGVYEIDRKEEDVSVMFDRAFLSLSTITDEFHVHIAYYDTKIREKILWDQNISGQLSDSIENRELCPYLQPIADRDGKIVGAEALARWEHPEYGFLAPYKFIPVFEHNGLIVDVDRYMWRCACEILSRWKKLGSDMFISVNISPKDFYFLDVFAEMKKLVAEYDIEPSRLRIEITETVMMNEEEDRMAILDEFRKAGFIVEMDDFGSGYSSLNMLKDMPVDVLKIDMKFLGKSSNVERAKIIVQNVISLAKDLGITALTEGVETDAHYSTLSAMGCALFQGYYFAKPMPVKEFETFAGLNGEEIKGDA